MGRMEGPDPPFSWSGHVFHSWNFLSLEFVFSFSFSRFIEDQGMILCLMNNYPSSVPPQKNAEIRSQSQTSPSQVSQKLLRMEEESPSFLFKGKKREILTTQRGHIPAAGVSHVQAEKVHWRIRLTTAKGEKSFSSHNRQDCTTPAMQVQSVTEVCPGRDLFYRDIENNQFWIYSVQRQHAHQGMTVIMVSYVCEGTVAQTHKAGMGESETFKTAGKI